MRAQTKEPIFSAVRSMLLHIQNIGAVRAGSMRCVMSGLFCRDHYESSRQGQLVMLQSARKYLESAREWELRKGYYGAASQARYFEAHGLLCDLVNGLELEMRLEISSLLQAGSPVSHNKGIEYANQYAR